MLYLIHFKEPKLFLHINQNTSNISIFSNPRKLHDSFLNYSVHLGSQTAHFYFETPAQA